MTLISPLKLKRYDVDGKTYFKYFIHGNNLKGKILCKNVMEASRKVLSSVIKKMKDTKEFTCEFSIFEYKGKIFSYNGTITVLEKPIKVQLKNKNGELETIVYKYNHRVEKMKLSEEDENKIIAHVQLQ
jgi:hypothetical protein